MTDKDASYIYYVLKRAIEEIDDAEGQITLADLAARMRMSVTHFQQLFSKWTGISTKIFKHYLTFEHSKQLLRNHHSRLDTALESGLSGKGRLHDFFITWEAVTPGRFVQKAKGAVICYTWVDSPFGEALIMATLHGICGISFSIETGREASLADMMKRWPNAEFQNKTSPTSENGLAFFVEPSAINLHVMGTPFQIKVWQALMNIPSGQVTTYSDVASAIGSPKAVRAVGTAIGKNPISWLIPCHRALHKSGELGGYHWGHTLKRIMLAYEAAQRDAET